MNKDDTMTENSYPIPRLALVTTFDILGVKRIMQTVSDAKLARVTREINDSFAKARSDAEEVIVSFSKNRFEKKVLEDFCKSVDVLNFSDTIVFTLSISDLTSGGLSSRVAYYFLNVCMVFYRMFKLGFPVRGCVDYGSICKEGDLIFGKPFVNSFTNGESLDFSGLVITKDAFDFYCLYNSTDLLNTLTLDVPIKSNNGQISIAKNIVCANWMHGHSKNNPYTPLFTDEQNLRSRMMEKFGAHGKSIDDSVMRKIVNTENIVRAFVLQNEKINNTNRETGK